MLQKKSNFIIKYYNEFFQEGHVNDRAHTGEAIFIHEAITHKEALNISL